jgi:hypothetical protein
MSSRPAVAFVRLAPKTKIESFAPQLWKRTGRMFPPGLPMFPRRRRRLQIFDRLAAPRPLGGTEAPYHLWSQPMICCLSTPLTIEKELNSR